jgi:hypothetical protein
MIEIGDITPEFIEAYLIEMVQTNAARPDPERRFLRGLVSGHPATGADWETHLAHADKPIDPVTGIPDVSVPRMRPAYPSASQISRAELAAGWIGRYVAVIEHRRVLGCTLIVKAQGYSTIWPRVRNMLQRAPRRRHSDSTLRRYYQRALNDIAAGMRADLANGSAQKASKAASRGSMVSRGQIGGKATQRAAERKKERV